MTNEFIDRRTFLQASGMALAGVGVMGFETASFGASGPGAPHAEKVGWRLGCQAWTFKDGTFFEAVAKTASLGLHYVEAFPGQRVGGSSAEPFTEGMSPAVRQEVKKHLADSGVKLVSFGVGGCSKPIFEFAKDMGIQTIVSEPPADAFDGLDRLTEEYGINVALHNHPKPSRYWNPDTVLKACQGHSNRIGACCDVGHWMRSGIDPLEALRKLEGRIIEFHFKDLNKAGRDAHDVPWGTGKADIKAILTEVHRQRLKPVFLVEYEYHWGQSLPEIAQSVAYFDQVAAEIG
jgi:sugar phosphate isomerase/epimerase